MKEGADFVFETTLIYHRVVETTFTDKEITICCYID